MAESTKIKELFRSIGRNVINSENGNAIVDWEEFTEAWGGRSVDWNSREKILEGLVGDYREMDNRELEEKKVNIAIAEIQLENPTCKISQ